MINDLLMGNKNLKPLNNINKDNNILYLGSRGSLHRVRGIRINDQLILTDYQTNIVWYPDHNHVNIYSTDDPNFVVRWPAYLVENTYLECWGGVGETLNDGNFLNILSEHGRNLESL